ncbi:MAG: serine/threonine protein kinase, partial [Muribaculaceae bacterium]|nr:serine/threonine protein kinase [Muribaculaceae bacterium]
MKDDVNGLKQGTVLHGTWTYTIDRVLGAGGFGITYLATGKGKAGNITVTLPFCIKEHYRGDLCERADDGTTVVCPGTATSRSQVADSLRDFVGEARRLLQVGAEQPNIVKVNEIIEANGTAYYAMEFLNGHTLADLIIERSRKGQTLTEAEVEALVYPIVNAAAYIHTKKMTHLDIKPENIMLHQDDEGHTVPVLIDFGLSKHYNEDGSATSKVNTMGCSDGYAPSEQYQGITTFSPAADVYALGATML